MLLVIQIFHAHIQRARSNVTYSTPLSRLVKQNLQCGQRTFGPLAYARGSDYCYGTMRTATLPIDFLPVTDLHDQDRLFGVRDGIDDAVAPLAEPVLLQTG